MIGVADLAAVLTAAGVTIYVLGLIGIYISIRRELLRHTSTAWYVTSLVPRTVVAGQGVRIWLGLPLFITIVELLIVFVAAASRIEWFLRAPLAPFSVFPIAIAGFVVVYLGIRQLLAHQTLGWAVWVNSVFPGLGSFPIAFAALLFSKGLGWEAGKSSFVWIDSIQNQFLVGGVLLFIGGFIIGVPLATTMVDPPFPRVWITVQDEGIVLKGVRLEGQLVAHSDGFWHLLTGKDKELMSLPDAQVCAVRIRARPAEPTVTKRAMFYTLIIVTSIGIALIISHPTAEGWDLFSWRYAIGILVAVLFAIVVFYVSVKVRKRTLRHHSQNKRDKAE